MSQTLDYICLEKGVFHFHLNNAKRRWCWVRGCLLIVSFNRPFDMFMLYVEPRIFRKYRCCRRVCCLCFAISLLSSPNRPCTHDAGYLAIENRETYVYLAITIIPRRGRHSGYDMTRKCSPISYSRQEYGRYDAE